MDRPSCPNQAHQGAVPMSLPVPIAAALPFPTLTHSECKSESSTHSLHDQDPAASPHPDGLPSTKASFSVPFPSQSSLPMPPPSLSPLSLPPTASQTAGSPHPLPDSDPTTTPLISTTPSSIVVDDPAPSKSPPPPVSQPNPHTRPAVSVSYPLAIHIAILATLCPTLSRPTPTAPTPSPDLTVTPPLPLLASPPPPTESTADLVPGVLASLTNLPAPPATCPAPALVVDTCSSAWDVITLAHDPDVGVLASCVDLVSLNVLEPAKSQHQATDDSPAGATPGWHIVPETVAEYWAYLMRSVCDPGLMAQLRHSFGEYLDRRAKLADARAKNQALMAALGPQTSEQQAKSALKDHIHHLHVYNEYQDLAQSIMGQLADMDGVTVKRVYQELGIDMDSDCKKAAA